MFTPSSPLLSQRERGREEEREGQREGEKEGAGERETERQTYFDKRERKKIGRQADRDIADPAVLVCGVNKSSPTLDLPTFVAQVEFLSRRTLEVFFFLSFSVCLSVSALYKFM